MQFYVKTIEGEKAIGFRIVSEFSVDFRIEAEFTGISNVITVNMWATKGNFADVMGMDIEDFSDLIEYCFSKEFGMAASCTVLIFLLEYMLATKAHYARMEIAI